MWTMSSKCDVDNVLQMFHLLGFYINLVASSDAENVTPTGIKKRRKPLSECSTSHCRRLKKEVASQCSASLSCLTDLGLVPYGVKVFNPETNQREELHLEVSDEVSSKLNDRDLVSIALMAKDKHMISGMLPIFFVCTYIQCTHVHFHAYLLCMNDLFLLYIIITYNIICLCAMYVRWVFLSLVSSWSMHV